MGTVTAPVVGSGSLPACIAFVAKPIVENSKFQVASSKFKVKNTLAAFNFELATLNLQLSSVEYSLTHVALGPVGEERDDALARAEALSDFARCRCRRAGRAAAEDAFGARQLADCREGFRVRDCDDFVRRLPVEVGRDELALSDAFEPVEARLAAAEYRAFGLDERAVDARVNLLQGARDARERSRGAAAEYERVHAPFGLFDYLARGRLLVYERVRGVLELLRDEAA